MAAKPAIILVEKPLFALRKCLDSASSLFMLERAGGERNPPSTHPILTRFTKMMRYNRPLLLGILVTFTGALAAFAANGKQAEQSSADAANVETVEQQQCTANDDPPQSRSSTLFHSRVFNTLTKSR